MGRWPGRSFGTLLAAGGLSNVGDGVTLAAAPLLAASITRDPRAIGAIGAAWSLPWLLFALVSGAVADRGDRRWLMVGADLTICWLLAVENLVEMAGLAMLVLLAQDVLGLDARGYGLLLAATSLPVVAGAAVALYGLAAVW